MSPSGGRGHTEVEVMVVGGTASTGGTTSGGASSAGAGSAAFAIGGTVSGLTTTPLTPFVLHNGTETVSLASNGPFQFATKLASGAAYTVTLQSPPSCPLYDCSVAAGSGTVGGSDINDVSVVCSLSGVGVPPRLFFTDLTSAPLGGGENGNGPYISLYGLGFGATPGTVTIGGKSALITQWGAGSDITARGLERVIIQLGPVLVANAAPQSLVLTDDAGHVSNALDFTVRSAGSIYLVDANAASDGTGTFANPFQLLSSARAHVVAGDVVYLKGTFSTADPDANACLDQWDNAPPALCLIAATTNSGTVAAPIAYVGYPGGHAKIPTPPTAAGVAQNGIDIQIDNIVVAGISFDDTNSDPNAAVLTSHSGARIVGCEVQQTGFGINWGSQHTRVLGNFISGHNYYNNTLISLLSSAGAPIVDTEVGWNELTQRNATAIDVLTNDDPGDFVDLTDIHDNLITFVQGNGVATSMAPTDNGIYRLSIRNNVIANPGFGCLAATLPLVSRPIRAKHWLPEQVPGTYPKGEFTIAPFARAADGAFYTTSDRAGVLRSPDGIQWTQAWNGQPPHVTGIVVTPDTIFASDDGPGSNYYSAPLSNPDQWSPMSAPSALATVGWAQFLAYDAAHRVLYSAAWEGGLFRYVLP